MDRKIKSKCECGRKIEVQTPVNGIHETSSSNFREGHCVKLFSDHSQSKLSLQSVRQSTRSGGCRINTTHVHETIFWCHSDQR